MVSPVIYWFTAFGVGLSLMLLVGGFFAALVYMLDFNNDHPTTVNILLAVLVIGICFFAGHVILDSLR